MVKLCRPHSIDDLDVHCDSHHWQLIHPQVDVNRDIPDFDESTQPQWSFKELL
jgi:hypothetical protein